mmetsp:Transcript_52475/g.135945  ORF Transcript_52475/g.135945 Transcript_52475/m.135945 type:complete len:267 (+) Transcript_52475:1372-2172(+)
MLEELRELERVGDRQTERGGRGGHGGAGMHEDHRDDDGGGRHEVRDDVEAEAHPLAGEMHVQLRHAVGAHELGGLALEAPRGAKRADRGDAGERLREVREDGRVGGRVDALEVARRSGGRRVDQRVDDGEEGEQHEEPWVHDGDEGERTDDGRDAVEPLLEGHEEVVVELLRVGREAVDDAPRRIGFEEEHRGDEHRVGELLVETLGRAHAHDDHGEVRAAVGRDGGEHEAGGVDRHPELEHAGVGRAPLEKGRPRVRPHRQPVVS